MTKLILPIIALACFAHGAHAVSIASSCSNNTLKLSYTPSAGEICNVEQTLVVNGVSTFEAITLDQERATEIALNDGDSVTLTVAAQCENADAGATSSSSRTIQLSSGCPVLPLVNAPEAVPAPQGIKAIQAAKKLERDARLAAIQKRFEELRASRNMPR